MAAHHPKVILYRNGRYGFVLRLPGWWRSYCVIRIYKADRSAEYEAHFKFKYRGKIYDDILAIMVYRMTRKEWLEQGYDDSPLVFLAEHRNRVFAGITPGELPDAFYDEVADDYDYRTYGTPIKLLKKMVNEEVPRIFSSFRFPPAVSSASPSTPLLTRKVRTRCRRTR